MAKTIRRYHETGPGVPSAAEEVHPSSTRRVFVTVIKAKTENQSVSGVTATIGNNLGEKRAFSWT